MINKFKFILPALLLLLLFLVPFFFKIKVECKSQFGNCPAKINSDIAVLNNKSLFNAAFSLDRILKNEALISSFSSQLKLPNIFLVNIITKKAVYAIKDRNSGKLYLTDINGQILMTSGESSLPTVEQDDKSPNLFTLKIISGVYQMYQVGYGKTENDTLVVDLPARVRVIFPLSGDPEVLLGALRLIYAKVTSDNPISYSQIDMRYKNPVLR